MKQLVYQGLIEEKSYGGDNFAIFIGDMDHPIAEEFKEELNYV